MEEKSLNKEKERIKYARQFALIAFDIKVNEQCFSFRYYSLLTRRKYFWYELLCYWEKASFQSSLSLILVSQAKQKNLFSILKNISENLQHFNINEEFKPFHDCHSCIKTSRP